MLFDDQKEIIGSVSSEMRKHKAILLQSPTGSGKTRMALHMMQKCLEAKLRNPSLNEKKVIFTVPRRDLLEQTSETLKEHGVSHSFIASDLPMNPYADCYIGMIDTMANRAEDGKLPKGYVAFVDETHFGASNLDAVIKNYREQGSWVIGLSGTPLKMNGKPMGDWYETMVKGKSIRYLINNKRLSDYDFYQGRTHLDTSALKTVNGQFVEKQVADYMEHQGVIIGDCVREYKERCMGKLHIVRASSIKHSQMIAEQFRNSGITAMHVDGKTDNRKQIFMAYARREIQVITFCQLLTFGFDLSQASGGMDVCIESGSDMKPCKSIPDQLQYWGRLLRYKNFKAVINDHVNNYQSVDMLPCTDVEWSLEGMAKKPGKKGTIPTRHCPECFYVHTPKPHCPECGYVYETQSREIEEVDGSLTKIELENFKRKEKLDRRKEQGQCRTFDELIAYGKKYGYSNPAGWAARVLAGRAMRS